MPYRSTPYDESWTERRETVEGWIRFVGDFGRIDVESLVACCADNTFVEAVEAVLKLGSRPWDSFEQVRDFCVYRLYGETPPTRPKGTLRPRHRVTPFSVPVPLLRDVFTPRDSAPGFDPRRLRTHAESFVIDLPNSETEGQHRIHWNQEGLLLFTTAWARVAPPIEPLRHFVRATDDAAARFIWNNLPLWTLIAEPQPLFQLVYPHGSIGVTVRGPNTVMPALSVLMTFEGWVYFP